MKVLHLSTWKETCGIAGYADSLLSALEAAGVTNEIHPLNKWENKYLSQSEMNEKLLRFCNHARHFDVAHIQHEFSFFHDNTGRLSKSVHNFHYLLGQLARRKMLTVITFHTEPPFILPFGAILDSRGAVLRNLRKYLQTTGWRKRIARFFVGRPARFRAIVPSRKLRLSLINSGFGQENIETIPHGLVARDEATLGIPKGIAKKRLAYPPDSVLLSLFGFLSAYKGPDVAINALQHLPPYYHLAIVGGPHPDALGDRTLDEILGILAKHPQLRGRVRVTGFADAATVNLYHAATDMCIAPYRPIGSASAALTWALSSGKPVIASRIPAFVEINEEANCMLLVAAGADFELAWQIERLWADRNLQNLLVRNASGYLAEHSWAAVAKRTAEVYETLVQSHSSRRRGVRGLEGPVAILSDRRVPAGARVSSGADG